MGWTSEGVPEVTIVQAVDRCSSYFPDICKCGDGLLVVYYWNHSHAPVKLGDSLETIMAVRGTEDAQEWGNPEPLITENTLIEWGLGVWADEDGLLY